MNFCKTHFDGVAREALTAIQKTAEKHSLYSGMVAWDDVEMQVWRQEWPDSRCGFPEKGAFFADEITVADTAVFKHLLSGVICVTHNHRVAYTVVVPNEAFYEHFKDRWLRGAEKYVGQYEENL